MAQQEGKEAGAGASGTALRSSCIWHCLATLAKHHAVYVFGCLFCLQGSHMTSQEHAATVSGVCETAAAAAAAAVAAAVQALTPPPPHTRDSASAMTEGGALAYPSKRDAASSMGGAFVTPDAATSSAGASDPRDASTSMTLGGNGRPSTRDAASSMAGVSTRPSEVAAKAGSVPRSVFVPAQRPASTGGIPSSLDQEGGAAVGSESVGGSSVSSASKQWTQGTTVFVVTAAAASVRSHGEAGNSSGTSSAALASEHASPQARSSHAAESVAAATPAVSFAGTQAASAAGGDDGAWEAQSREQQVEGAGVVLAAEQVQEAAEAAGALMEPALLARRTAASSAAQQSAPGDLRPSNANTSASGPMSPRRNAPAHRPLDTTPGASTPVLTMSATPDMARSEASVMADAVIACMRSTQHMQQDHTPAPAAGEAADAGAGVASVSGVGSLPATPEDLARLKEDILEGLRQALMEALPNLVAKVPAGEAVSSGCQKQQAMCLYFASFNSPGGPNLCHMLVLWLCCADETFCNVPCSCHWPWL